MTPHNCNIINSMIVCITQTFLELFYTVLFLSASSTRTRSACNSHACISVTVGPCHSPDVSKEEFQQSVMRVTQI